MPDILAKLVHDATARVAAGYYNTTENVTHSPISLKRAIQSAEANAIIAEIKPVSPALGPLRPDLDPVEVAARLAKGGAAGLSVLTEPDNFGGNIDFLPRIRANVKLPLLMKDIIVDKTQIQAGSKLGADAILLIESAFDQNTNLLTDLIQEAHLNHLEVLLEVHSHDEFGRALTSEADIIGINNRNLRTLETDLNTTTRLLRQIDHRTSKPIISESGFETADDVRKMLTAAVNGFLIGSSIMLSQDLESKVREFVLA